MKSRSTDPEKIVTESKSIDPEKIVTNQKVKQLEIRQEI
jgi:hypothetical protein